MADLINSCFESFAGLFVILNIRQLLRDRKVAGVSLAPHCFFLLWGGWNLYYYPNLGQWASFAGCMVIFAMNGVWFGLAVYYIRKERNSA